MVFCRACNRWVGLCAAIELEEVADGARRLLLTSDQRKRRGGTNGT